jgi:hypothetical protein
MDNCDNNSLLAAVNFVSKQDAPDDICTTIFSHLSYCLYNLEKIESLLGQFLYHYGTNTNTKLPIKQRFIDNNSFQNLGAKIYNINKKCFRELLFNPIWNNICFYLSCLVSSTYNDQYCTKLNFYHIQTKYPNIPFNLQCLYKLIQIINYQQTVFNTFNTSCFRSWKPLCYEYNIIIGCIAFLNWWLKEFVKICHNKDINLKIKDYLHKQK